MAKGKGRRHRRPWHHGRRVRAQPRRRPAGMSSASTSIRRAAGPWPSAGVEIAANVPSAGRARCRPSSPVCRSRPRLIETVAAIAAHACAPRVIVEASTFALDDKLAAERALRNAGHIMLDCPVSGTGAQAKVKDLVVYASGDPQAIRKLRPLFAGFSRAGPRPRRLRQWQPHEICRQPPGRDPQRGERRGHGARHEGRARRPDRSSSWSSAGAGNSRVFELRAPMMVKNRYDDATMKNYRLAEGHGGDRGFCEQARRADAAVRRHLSDLCQAHDHRPCRARHGCGLCRAGKDGRRHAQTKKLARVQKIQRRRLSQHGFRDRVARRMRRSSSVRRSACR